MSTLYVIGGANGSGKTSWYLRQTSVGDFDPTLPFINVDWIVQKELGDYTAENILQAEMIAQARMRDLIGRQEDFMIESNLARSSDFEWLENMKSRAGYELVLYYLGTDDVTVNKERVKRRVAQGGHEVPEAIIEQRYLASKSNLATNIALFDEIMLHDVANVEIALQAQLKQRAIIYKSEPLATWAKTILRIPEALLLKKTRGSQPKQSPNR